MPRKNDKIAIVGAGVFGLTLALELKKRGYENITVLDRHAPPVPERSSVDISRIVRADYADEIYMKMGMEAEAAWKEYSHFYHNSVILITTQTNDHPYVTQTKELLANQGPEMMVYDESHSMKHLGFGGTLDRLTGYSRQAGGWVDSEGVIRHLAQC